ncbi:PIN-like domain-containing protein [Pelagihabitans pacificus]|nr:hypothetical protein [Pelagihabitans pacificus]
MPKHLAHGFNTIQIAEGLKTGHEVTVKFLPEVFNYGADDAEWIPKVGKERSCVITQDLNISKRKDELELYQKNGVGMFFLRGRSKKQGLSIWEMVQALSKNWDAICKIALEEERPFGYTFQLNGKMRKVV